MVPTRHHHHTPKWKENEIKNVCLTLAPHHVRFLSRNVWLMPTVNISTHVAHWLHHHRRHHHYDHHHHHMPPTFLEDCRAQRGYGQQTKWMIDHGCSVHAGTRACTHRNPPTHTHTHTPHPKHMQGGRNYKVKCLGEAKSRRLVTKLLLLEGAAAGPCTEAAGLMHKSTE